MFCPVCLGYGQQVQAISQVDGTQYCATHAVEAVTIIASRGRGPRNMRPGNSTGFTPPPPIPANAVPSTPPPASATTDPSAG